ncbi:unnamed protein product [Brachionus calyciflorus]|uniref:SZT2 n=1 Tax=Brachionus calyciflorus TaxID=104777 RepID=A0A813UG01_9BILA|nr:unnamed protein product [Brachionus calyciflorus]
MIIQDPGDLYHLFDKHLKSGDNYLPLKAFLQYIERNNQDLDGFRTISSIKSANIPQSTDQNKTLNLASTFKIIQKTNESEDIILAQILYKIVITIDYSPQSSSLDFIQTSLETIFTKISLEFDDFYSNCFNTEPQIYVTVILFNSSPNQTSQSQIPFTIILHSKRLLKSNLNEIALFIFNKITETKFIILDTLKSDKTELRINTGLNEDDLYQQHTHKTKNNKSSFEELIRILIKIFNFFEITPPAVTSLASAHHIHITEGIIHANDMMRCLEKISKSSISFSFIYTGTSSHLPGSNISSSLGHMANCSLMKLIAKMTNGFCLYLNEYLSPNAIVDKTIFNFYNLKYLSLNDESKNRDEIRHYFNKDTELKLIHKNEIQKEVNLMQLIRCRVQEGFYLIGINRKEITDKFSISLYFRKYFTQTVNLVFKLNYTYDFVEFKYSKYNYELWISWDALQLKAKYQNVDLLKRIKQYLNQMQLSMANSQFELSPSMLDPPEILAKFKEPLYKLSNDSMTNENNQMQKSTFSLQNLNFELNNRTIKNNEIDYYNQFAYSWNYLAFFKLTNKALNRFFAINSIKILMHHDRPLPEVNTCIFDTKTRASLESNTNSNNQNNIFQSSKSINELRSMLTTWCDIMLVENCVFLRFLESSSQLLKPQSDNQSKITEINNTEQIKNSFVICIVYEQYTPYTSLQFLFNSNISHSDRMRLIKSFKDKLSELNFKKSIENTDDSLVYHEHFYILKKPELYDAFKFILFDEIQNTSDPKLNQSSKLINFLIKKKFKWIINKKFSSQTAQALKEMLIDTFIRMRLKEGFKCLFQSSKFVVFTLQLTMFDSANNSQNKAFKNGSSQSCSFIYVIRFLNSKKSNLLNVATNSNNEQDSDNNPNDHEETFITELYTEAIDGIYQDRGRKKDRVDYFKNLSNLEILNLIYLQDLKCYSIIQSSYALFLTKSNLMQNLESLMAKIEVNNLNQIIDNLAFKDNLMSIIQFDSKYYESIRLLPDLGLVLLKHSIKELKNSKSRLSNPTSQYLFNRVNYNNRSMHKRELVNQSNINNANIESEGVKKKSLSLYEQLRPVVNSIDISRFYLNQVEFDFSLRGVLLESSLFVCVYDDIPINLFNLQDKNCVDGSRKIQSYFFQNVDETFKKLDEFKENNQSVINSMKSDIKNTLMLKINDIKTGDSITKKILEHLRQTDDLDSFKSFIKFNISHVTSKQSVASPSNSTLNQNKIDNQKSNPWTSHFQTNLINQQFDVENNKFYVYGLFFIPSESTTMDQDPNRLVIFVFNTVPENIKSSLVHTQSNSFLTRKPLFTSNSNSEYKFYHSKNSIFKTSSNQDLKSQQIPLNLKKLSDILKHNLIINVQNDSLFLNLIDLIEENCAKTYIKSVINYLASDLNSNINIEKTSIQRLLRLGLKIKLTDIDLTDYFIIKCKHMLKFDALETCDRNKSNYLDDKFNEIFLKRFQCIPGFNDLFIFQPDLIKNVNVYLKNEDEINLEEEENDEEIINESESLVEDFYDTDEVKQNQLKSSSPFSNMKKSSSSETSFVSKEQIIGIEIVCQVSCDNYNTDNETRTRTTTLTPENNEMDESLTTTAANIPNKHVFYSKFTQFNFNCILDLVESKDTDAFKNLLSKLSSDSEDKENFIKVYLRFNWYSFNDINLNYPLNLLSSHSSSATNVFNTAPQFLTQKLNYKFDNFKLFEPSLLEFQWYFKNELLNHETNILKAKTFLFYTSHIKHGCDRAYLNCANFNKKIVLNKSTTTIKMSSKDSGQSKNAIFLGKNKIVATTQVEEDKTILCVDAKKFSTEFNTMIKNSKFCDCSLQILGDNLFFFNCNYQSINFKIFLTLKRECLKVKPNSKEDESSSPNSLSSRLQTSSQVLQEIIINQAKFKAYFSFNYSELSRHDDSKKIVQEIVDNFDVELDRQIRLSYLKIVLKDIDETRKWNNLLHLSDLVEDRIIKDMTTSLTCACVWSYNFKLHRLHQTLQKSHETNHQISQGLNKLRECLNNFKIYESTCGDLYVYTRNDQIFLLKLEECCDEDERRGSILSRRPSYASINDTEQSVVITNRSSTHGLRNPSGGGGGPAQVQTPQTQTQQKSNPPEAVKLSVYGLEEPDDEMKKDLCKTLQSELDYWLLNRMCTAIEKNTYKTTSQMHPDKITDEDLHFFKQISDNTFDYELTLPFVFNFNRTLRENFIFFLKQVFNTKFKSIDSTNQLSKNLLNNDGSGLGDSSKNFQTQLSTSSSEVKNNFTKKNSDPLHTDMLLISRIFFQNLKSKRIGKQNVSLVLVEALYSIKGLDLISNKVTRSNSMGASSIKYTPEHGDKKSRQLGPTFLFRFYCRGDNPEIVNYKQSLKLALNDALVYFLSDLITKIDPGEYLKKIMLKRQAARFSIADTDLNVTRLNRKRHKSTGANELNSKKHFLRMNKTARESQLGRLLAMQKISDSAQLNNFVMANFTLNLFDYKDYEDTFLYFKETCKILNFLNIESFPSESDSDFSDTEDTEEIGLYKVQRSLSMEPDLNKIERTNEKTCLKLIHDWLREVNNQKNQIDSLVLRRQFGYKTKYNLVNLVKDLESCLKDMCKCELNVNYYSFKENLKDYRDSVFLDDEDLDEFSNLKMSKLCYLGLNLAKGENLIMTLNAEYGGLNSGFSSMSSSMNSSTLTNYTRMGSVGSTNQSSSNSNNTLVKSMCSVSGDLESSFSLSNSLTLSNLNIKRTFCYLMVNAKSKNVYFYCFTTESANHDSLKQWLDQTSDLIIQRYHLINNTVLYKFGGFIGDNLINDLKKVKQLAMSASSSLCDSQSVSQTDLVNQENKTQAQKQQQLTSVKLSKSPTIHRQLSYNKPSPGSINPSLIANLQFNSINLPSPSAPTNQANIQTHSTQSQFSMKQLYMTQFNMKSYDSIVNIINQQVNFCIQYLTPPPASTNTTDSILSPNPKTLNQPKISSLYGVGLCYQLLEMQQIYRHPRKIYELAIGMATQQNISPNSQTNTKNQIRPISSTTSLVSPINQTILKFNLNDFYKNYIQPVLIPFHYCCTPLLFFSNWSESITSEKMLRKNSNTKTSNTTKTQNNTSSVIESWYCTMRQIVLVEYTKYLEARGFIRLRDERQLQENNNQNKKNPNMENQILHFIKWIQQDGFLYLNINLEEIYVQIRVGFCSRYRSANRLTFINELIRFLNQDFHVHSFIYDIHLSAINSNFLSTSPAGMQISQTSYIISKFLDEFVEYFNRVPVYTQNKVFKLVYEKPDNSLKPNQHTLIFDFISYANKKLNENKIPIQTLHTFGNNLTIYSLSDQNENNSKYLIVKIEQFYKDVLRPFKANQQQLMGTNNSQEKFMRITCFYLFINKSVQPGLFSNQNILNCLNNDLDFINRVIEESISMHRQEIFWDNLAQSMYSIKNFLNESTNQLPLIGFEINNQELEQILAISQQINILDLDSCLDEFMQSCFEIKDKIKEFLKFRLGRYYISTESDSIEYCLLILNESLIKNFRLEEEDTRNSISESEPLKSFILIKFDKVNKRADLYQVNRVKIVETGVSVLPSQSTKDINQIVFNLNKNKSYKSFAFTINILMYILWDNLFSTN